MIALHVDADCHVSESSQCQGCELVAELSSLNVFVVESVQTA